MNTKAFLGAFLLWIAAVSAYPQVTFILTSIPDYTPPADIIYIAGDFNGWNPGNPAQALQKNADGLWSITLAARPAGTRIEYKFTRGNWAKVEKGQSGEEISNRTYTFSVADTVRVTVYHWADRSGGETTTAAKNVSRLSDTFPIPQLGTTRRIWLYLPPGYEESTKSYPVLYMHDGQNVFDAYTAFAGEWNVDETLNTLASEGVEVPIVVAVDNGGSARINEYSPWKNPNYGGGKGDLYVDFIAKTLKPYIDSAFRTRPEPEHTGIAGSSMGGLISWYGIFKYPDVFGKAGVFSPSYWFSDSVWTYLSAAEKHHPLRIYQVAGSAEGASMVSGLIAMQDSLVRFGYGENELKSKIVEGAGHNEAFWRSEFREAYLWLFQPSTGIENPLAGNAGIRIYPNPAGDRLTFIPDGIPGPFDAAIYSIAGGLVAVHKEVEAGRPVDISLLQPGKYLLRITTGKTTSVIPFIKL